MGDATVEPTIHAVQPELEPADWQLRLSYNTVWVPEKGLTPNAFNRLMCRLVFGLRWERRDNG